MILSFNFFLIKRVKYRCVTSFEKLYSCSSFERNNKRREKENKGDKVTFLFFYDSDQHYDVYQFFMQLIRLYIFFPISHMKIYGKENLFVYYYRMI